MKFHFKILYSIIKYYTASIKYGTYDTFAALKGSRRDLITMAPPFMAGKELNLSPSPMEMAI